MLYTNKDTFILSAAGCSNTEPDSLETIMTGNEAGANGCCISVDLTADGIAVLCTNGGFTVEGEFLALKEHTYLELRNAVPKIVTIGQAIELAKCCSAKVAITLKNTAACPAVKIALSTADMLDNAYITGLGMIEAARLAGLYPALHIVGDLPEGQPSLTSIVRAARETGLFGLRAQPRDLSPELVQECRRSGLFTASHESSDLDELERLLGLGVNFIETERPDLAYILTPSELTGELEEPPIAF